jgi:AraC-like DNA-binding protein
MQNPLERIAEAADDRDQATEELFDAIADAVHFGLPVAAVAKAARMSRTHVRRIADKASADQ